MKGKEATICMNTNKEVDHYKIKDRWVKTVKTCGCNADDIDYCTCKRTYYPYRRIKWIQEKAKK